jgi:uncharacterized protein with NRDE domain
LNVLRSFLPRILDFLDEHHEHLTIQCEAFGTRSSTFFIIGRSERSAFMEWEFTRVDNGS